MRAGRACRPPSWFREAKVTVVGLGGGPPTPTPARAAQPALESDSLIAPLGGGGGEAARDGTSQAISGGLALRRETVPEAGFLAPRRLVPAHREARAAGPAVSCHRSSPVRGSTAIFDLGRFKLRLVGCSHRRVSCRVPPRPRTHTHPPLLPSLARVPSPSRRFPTSVRPAWSCRLSQEVAATVRGGGCVFPTAALSRSLAPQGSPVTECVWGDPRGPRGGGSPQGTGLWEGRNTMGGGKGGEREETGGARPQEGLS